MHLELFVGLWDEARASLTSLWRYLAGRAQVLIEIGIRTSHLLFLDKRRHGTAEGIVSIKKSASSARRNKPQPRSLRIAIFIFLLRNVWGNKGIISSHVAFDRASFQPVYHLVRQRLDALCAPGKHRAGADNMESCDWLVAAACGVQEILIFRCSVHEHVSETLLAAS